jgi:AhpC/TSA antioxidant enzyme
MHCRHRLAQLELHKAELKAAGLQLIALGLGKPEHAERYCGTLAPSLTCFADTTNDSYYAWGLRQGTLAEGLANSLNILRASAKAARNGHTQGKSTGDVYMLPGTFIVDTSGLIRYACYSKFAGDDPEIAELITVAQSLQASAQ